jgi:hypothetical protein
LIEFLSFSFSFSGIPGTVFNGVCDWVYEEEVISDTRAVWFSPDGKHVAWIEFNDTEVDLMPLEIYGQPGRLEFQYPIPTPLRLVCFKLLFGLAYDGLGEFRLITIFEIHVWFELEFVLFREKIAFLCLT